MLSPQDFFDLNDHEQLAQIFDGCEYVWNVLPRLKHFLADHIGNKQTIDGYVMDGAHISDRPIYIAEGARVEPGAYIQGPAYIAAGVTVRHGAYIRENVVLLENSHVGHASEVKNSLLLPGAHAPHFNYVGDSVLGRDTNLGAGTKLSNLTLVSEKDQAGKRPTIHISIHGTVHDTGLTKMGAILGDEAQTGCNAVLNPGVLLGRRTLAYANLSLRKGYYPADSILKLRQTTATADRR